MASDDGKVPTWIPVAGLVFGSVTLLFFMGLTAAAVMGHQIPPASRSIVVIVLAFGFALSASFVGGTARANGQITIPGTKQVRPISFAVAGGVAAFVVVFALGELFYVNSRASDPATITGTVFDVDTRQGLPHATVFVKAVNTYDRTTADNGDFKFDDVPDQTGQQVMVYAKAANYRDSESYTVLLDRGNSRFSIPMTNCYNGVWHETDNYGSINKNAEPLKWQFEVKGDELHILRVDGFVSGDFKRSSEGWKGSLSWGNTSRTTDVLIHFPNNNCDEIITNQFWSYRR